MRGFIVQIDITNIPKSELVEPLFSTICHIALNETGDGTPKGLKCLGKHNITYAGMEGTTVWCYFTTDINPEYLVSLMCIEADKIGATFNGAIHRTRLQQRYRDNKLAAS